MICCRINKSFFPHKFFAHIQKGKGATETFTVRKVSSGVGVERTFPVNSPNIASIEVVKKGKVRRAKLYFLRTRESQYKIKERR